MSDGPVVARGRIRVDARKAEAKLREHMLVDLHLYACELARVAVATGATELAVAHDDRAITFAFEGTIAPDIVARARDEVLGGESAEHHSIRLLGIAISAALSLLRVVEVHTAGTCVRFTDVDSAPSTAPSDVRAGAMRVVVRNAFVAAALGRVFGSEPRRELALLRAAVAGGPLALVVNGVRVAPAPEPFRLRVPLEDPEATSFLDVVPGQGGEVVFREHGLRLASYPLAFARVGDATLPLRLVVDAARLPTNASRSEVRLADGVAARVLKRAAISLDRVLVALEARALRGAGVDRAITVAADDATLETALATFAVAIARAGDAPTKRAQQLVDLPLLDGAFGKRLSLAEALASRPLHVYSGEEPIDPALGPLLGRDDLRLVWRHGRPAETILDRHPHVLPADDLVAQAVAGAARRARALEHPAVEPRLEERAWALRQTFRYDDARFGGLHGEIGVERPGALAKVRVFVEERFLEEIPLPGVKLPIAIALAWPSTFGGNLAYDAVARTPAFDAAVNQAVRVAALAIVEHASDAESVRLATLAWASASYALGDAADAPANVPPFADAEVWPLTSGEDASLRTLAAWASARGGHLCTAPTRGGEAIDGRPVVVEAHARLLGEILRDVRLVPYGRYVGRSRARLRVEAEIAVRFERPSVEGTLLRGTGRHRMYHAGISIGDVPLPGLGGSTDVVWEDDAAIPADGGEVLWRTPLSLADDLAELDARHVRKVARAQEARVVEREVVAASAVDERLAALAGLASAPGFFLHEEACALFHEVHRDAPFRAIAALAPIRLPTLGGFAIPIPFEETTLRYVRRTFTPRPGTSSPDAVVVAPAGPARDRFERLLHACGIVLVDVTTELEPPAVRPPPPSPVEEPVPPSVPVTLAPFEDEPSFFAGIVRQVRRLFEPPPEVLATSPLTQALAENLAGLALTGRPVASVVEGTRGRPVRYETEHRRVVVNARHPVVQRLAARPDGMIYLLLAATSEINRELVEVTDAEELAVVHALLR